MKKSLFQIAFFTLILSLGLGCSQQPADTWVQLYNGQNLENWDLQLGSSLGADFDSLAQAATVDKVFTIVEENGEKFIRISGEINGALATKESFENYHLQLVYRWGETVYSSRNSGLLYHSFGPFRAAFGTWMANIECQLMHENLGDTYLMVNTTCETAAVQDTTNQQFYFTPGANPVQFGEQANGRMIRKAVDAEKPLGGWNTVDLYCVGRTAVHVVNGVTVMVNNNTGILVDGNIQPLTSGKIQIQSEGAELFVKKVAIQPITEIPAELLQ
ncbi:hypothetical protein BA6E_10138 [Bacteroidales bacterium 6E]|nr:hypothetical protein BA6E_10138 [Bacteroidales bacterium 6E]